MDKVKEKIISLVPEISSEPVWYEKEGCITLADVLRAIQPYGWNTLDMLVGPTGIAIIRDTTMSDEAFAWNLTTDYDGQTQGVKEFVGRLIGAV